MKVRRDDGTIDYLDTLAFMFTLKANGHLTATPLSEVRKLVYSDKVSRPIIAALDGAVGGAKPKAARVDRTKPAETAAT